MTWRSVAPGDTNCNIHHPTGTPNYGSKCTLQRATAIICISSIHLLKTFINAANYDEKVLMWQTIIHVTFLLSALAIAYTDKLLTSNQASH